jgi:hypothetical protein
MRLLSKLDVIQSCCEATPEELAALIEIARAAFALRYATEPVTITEPRLDRALEALERAGAGEAKASIGVQP